MLIGLFGLLLFHLPLLLMLGAMAEAGQPPARQVVKKPLSWFKPDPNQPRRHFDEPDLRQLGESLKSRQHTPITARYSGLIIDGERRYRAALLLGLATLDVIITDEVLSEGEILLIQLTANVARADLTDAELYASCQRVTALHPQWSNQDVAQRIGMSPSMVTRIVKMADLCPEAMDAFLAGKFRIRAGYSIAQMPTREEQLSLLEMVLAGMPVEQAASISRAKRKPPAATAGDAARLTRVTVPVQGAKGVTLSLSGDGLDMAKVVEALAETLKEARKAADRYDLRTWQAMMKDKAKA